MNHILVSYEKVIKYLLKTNNLHYIVNKQILIIDR